MTAELHLPDLPEVPISLGPPRGTTPGGPRPRVAMPWHLRLRDALSSYLPVLLMALLALATWWLVQNSPKPLQPAAEQALSQDPDYTMTGFAIERFDASGRLTLRLEGQRLRHFPATDYIEIEEARIRAIGADGRVTLARAARALGTGDGSELQLLGGAEVTASDASGVPLVMRGEFLHAFLLLERIQTHLPVQVQQGPSVLQAAGLSYDHALQKMDLQGPLRVVLPPRASPTGARP